MKSLEIERKTVDEAIEQGLEELGLSLEEVSIDVLSEGSKGILGFLGAKPAKVRLSVRGAQQEAAPPKEPTEVPPEQASGPAERPAPRVAPKPRPTPAREAEPQAQARPAPAPRREPPRQQADATEKPRRPRRERDNEGPLETGEADVAVAFLVDVAQKMGVQVQVSAHERDGTLCLDIEGDEKGILIGHRGETLDSLQYLTGLVHNKGRQQYRRVQLDAQNYRKKREETLIRLANRLADKAYRTNHSVALEPMNPYERRILHSALQGHPHVTTASEGEEPNRRVVILPK